MQVYFETITIQRDGSIRVWLRHAYRMLACNFNDLVQLERSTRATLSNQVPLRINYTEFKSLAPFQDCKMPILWEVHPFESLTAPLTMNSQPAEEFFIDREECVQLESTTMNVLRLNNNSSIAGF